MTNYFYMYMVFLTFKNSYEYRDIKKDIDKVKGKRKTLLIGKPHRIYIRDDPCPVKTEKNSKPFNSNSCTH